MATTVGEVRRCFEHLASCAAHVLDGAATDQYGPPRFVLQEGSRTYGRAWRIYATGGDRYGTAWHDVLHLGDGFIGSSREEARRTMRGIIVGISVGRKAVAS